MVAAGQRRQETCATPTAACHNVTAAEPFRFETVSTIKEINYFRYNVNECERGCGGGAGRRVGGFDSRQMCSHFRPGVLFGAQDRSCPSHVPQRTRYKFVTTNAWVQFEMCFFLAYAVRVSYTQNKKHMYKSRSAQRGLPAKLWGEQYLVHTLYLWYSLYRPRSELCTNWTQAQDM